MDKPMALIKDLLSDYADRRRDLRYPCQLAGVIESEQGALECDILSLSSSGLSARCVGKLQKGETVSIRPEAEERSLRCQVEWGSKAGADNVVRLSLQEPLEESWWASALESLSEQARLSRQRRGGVRVKCRIPARLTLPGEEQREAVILDLGTTGARVQSEGALPETMRLDFGPLDHLPAISAEVKLIHDGEEGHHGLLFTGFGSGGAKDLLDYVNHVFQPKRSAG